MIQKVPKAKVNLNNKKDSRVVRISKNDYQHDNFAKAGLNSVLEYEGILSICEYLSCNMSKLSKCIMGNIPQTVKKSFEIIFAMLRIANVTFKFSSNK